MSIAVAERVLPSWARAARLTCVRAAGDSLESAYGGLVVVAQERRVAVDEQLFVVRIGDALVVKRFRQVAGRWSLVSDSLAHLPRPMTADDRIVGRVAWCGPLSAVEPTGWTARRPRRRRHPGGSRRRPERPARTCPRRSEASRRGERRWRRGTPSSSSRRHPLGAAEVRGQMGPGRPRDLLQPPATVISAEHGCSSRAA